MKYHELISAIRTPFFTHNDILFAGYHIHPYQLSLWVNKGYLNKLKNGIYAFSKDFDRLKGEEIASVLYQPSYLSLESALAFYSLIPETVFAYVSVTAKINRTFSNQAGHFIYRHIKNDLFWGYTEKKTDKGRFLIAEPEKAVLDYLYLNLSKIKSMDDFNAIRLNIPVWNELIDKDKFLRYLAAFKIKKLEKLGLRCLQ